MQFAGALPVPALSCESFVSLLSECITEAGTGDTDAVAKARIAEPRPAHALGTGVDHARERRRRCARFQV